jgi:hypothetical protein
MHLRRPCAADGCTQFARNLSRLCGRHLKVATTYGHPQGRRIRAPELRPFKRKAARLLKQYRMRADVSAALRWLDKLLSYGGDDPMGSEMYRLRCAEVKPEEVFTATLAVYAYHLKHPRSLPDDMRLTVALSRAILKLRKKPRRRTASGRLNSAPMSRKALRDVGLRIREALPLLYVRLIELEHAECAEEANLLSTIRGEV